MRCRSCGRSSGGSQRSYASRTRRACATGSSRSRRSARSWRACGDCGSSPSASSRPAIDGGRRRAFYVAKGQVVCARPYTGRHGLEWEAALDAVRRRSRRSPPTQPTTCWPSPRSCAGPARARGGRASYTEVLMNELRELALGRDWRKLVADGVAASPVELRRGPAVKVVDGVRTETVPQSTAGRRASTSCSSMRATFTCTRPTGDVHARRTKRGRWLVSRGRPSAATAPVPAATTARSSIRCRADHPLFARHPQLTGQAPAGPALRRAAACAAALGARSDARASTPAAARRTSASRWSRTARARDAGRAGRARRERRRRRDGARHRRRARLRRGAFRGDLDRVLRGRRAGRPARVAARLRHGDGRGDRGRRPPAGGGDRRRAVLPSRARGADRKAGRGRAPPPRPAARPAGRPRHRRAPRRGARDRRLPRRRDRVRLGGAHRQEPAAPRRARPSPGRARRALAQYRELRDAYAVDPAIGRLLGGLLRR